jgi:hypothetical protein
MDKTPVESDFGGGKGLVAVDTAERRSLDST